MCHTLLGPWFAAELTKGHIGLVFVHGLYLKGRWIPEATVYVYGVFQVCVKLFYSLSIYAYPVTVGIWKVKNKDLLPF